MRRELSIFSPSVGCAAIAVICVAAACAAPIQRVAPRPVPSAPAQQAQVAPVPRPSPDLRPRIGVAFGGGSARGLAHVGVIRWFEENRIPIDLAAGTSMGGLIGGSFATGMNAAELESMLGSINWDEMFGSSTFKFKNIRRKDDHRAFPSRLEFGLKRGIVAPESLNSGQQVELLLDRIAGPYDDLPNFDALPTPFRGVAVDLVSATEVVLDRGLLARAMRATMSLPLIFPPVELDGHVLVDGGAMNNVPADVVRKMGADRVVAINVGDLDDRTALSYTMLGLAGATIDAMMRASTRRSMTQADVVVNVPLTEFGSLDWRRSAELITAGYQAAEANRAALLPFAVSEAEYAAWQAQRSGRRRQALPVPLFVASEGFAASDARRLETTLARHVGVPVVTAELEADLSELAGLDRYETVTWRVITNDRGEHGLMVSARVKPYAPPFMMLGLNLENTTSSDFRVTATARYLAFGVLTSGSELRVDGTLGSNPAIGVALYEPFRSSPLFIAPYAGITTDTAESLGRDVVIAKYEVTTSRVGLDVGVNFGTRSDLRVGAYYGHVDAGLTIGDPSLPELRGSETGWLARWRYDTQDSPVVPSGGTQAVVRWQRMLDGPDGVVMETTVPLNDRVHQLAATATRFWSLGEPNRLFVYGGVGTSFDGTALPTDTFVLGTPMRLGAYRRGELRGSHYYVATGGYLRQVGRLPDFLGGPVFAGGWVENGDAFEDWNDAAFRTNATMGVLMDTLLGPVMMAGSASFDGRFRWYVGLGRLFR